MKECVVVVFSREWLLICSIVDEIFFVQTKLADGAIKVKAQEFKQTECSQILLA